MSYSGGMSGHPPSPGDPSQRRSRKGARLALRVLFRSPDGAVPQVRNLKQMAFFPRLGITLNRLQKNGSSTAMSFLYLLEHGEQMAALDAKEHAVHLSDMGLRGVLTLRRTKRLVIVRDPFSRTLSAFLDKFRYPGYQRNFGQFELNPDGFRSFLSFLENGGLRANSHWSPQSDRILLPLDQYDAVLPFSSFPHSFVSTVENAFPKARDKWADFSHVDIDGPPRTDAGEKVVSFYNRDDIATVERLYSKDLEFAAIRDEADRVRESFEHLSGGR